MKNRNRKIQSILVMGFGFSLLLASNVTPKSNLINTVTPITPAIKVVKQNMAVAGVTNNIKNIFDETKTMVVSNIEPTIEENEVCVVAAPNMESGIANKDVPYYASTEDTTVLGHFNFNTKINYMKVNDDFGIVNYDGSQVYFHLTDLCEENTYNLFEVASYPGTKTYESYTVFGKSTPQQKLQNAATTDEQGFRRLNNRYMVALGSRFTSSIGQYFDLVLANGTIIPCMLSDQKSDMHTDPTHTWTIANESYCCSEFCVDTTKIKASGVDGDVSRLNGWNSRVVEIRVYDYNYFSR